MTIASAEAKARVLSNGIKIDNEALAYLSKHPDYKHESYVYNDSRWQLREFVELCPQELCLSSVKDGNETVVSCIINQSSPISLTVRDEQLAIHDRVAPDLTSRVSVKLLPDPSYCSEIDANGVPFGRYVSTCGLCEANIWLWHDCFLPYDRRGCAFCGINTVATKRKRTDLLSASMLSDRDTAQVVWEERKTMVLGSVVRALKRALETYEPYQNHFHLVFIAGNMRNGLLDLQWSIYVEAMLALEDAGIPLSDLDSTAVLMPPNDFAWIRNAKEAGLGKIAFNLEIWDQSLFEELCPGKAQYGRERMISALGEAVKVFGPGNVWSNFIYGLEPTPSLLQGMKWLAGTGIVPGANVFHKDRGARLRDVSIPSDQQIISFYRQLADIYHEFELSPFYCEKGLRTSLANEAFKGWI